MSRPNFIEVCSGGGGLSLGFIEQGFTPLLLNDVNKYCIETLKLNHPNVNIFSGSMTDIDCNDFTDVDVDVLMGGVPCQSFSMAGKRGGLEDARGGLILEFLKMVSEIKPKVFLIENVKGLISHNKGKTLKTVLTDIENLGTYNVVYKVLNSNDYSVPQKRERLILVGVRKDLNKNYSFPLPHEYKPVLKDVLEDCPASLGIEYSEKKKKLFDCIPQGGCWVNLPVQMQKDYMGASYFSSGGKRGILKRLDMEKPSLTLLTTPSQKQTERCHPLYSRPLQTLEYARIQTFPDEYKFFGSVHQIYKQIGNAVPVNMSKSLAKQLIDDIMT